jgi:NodT family efflux transporter outer membrane factor (OMF) lipoprotein
VERPDVDLEAAPGWTAQVADTLGIVPADTVTAADRTWWTSFEDPRLDSLVTEALTHNYNFQAAATRLDQAAALARIAGADLWPQLNLGAQGRRQKQNFIGLPVPGSEGGVLSSTSTSLGVSVDMSWEIDLWGRIRAGQSAALADAQATYADVAGVQLSLASQTAKTWFAVIEARQQLKLSQDTVESFRQAADVVRERFNLGVRTSLDLRLALTQLHQAEALLYFREQQLEFAVRQLEVLLGRYPSGGLETVDELPTLPGPVPGALPSELLYRRPDLASAERRIAAADKRLAEAKRSLLPRISLTGGAGTVSSELGDLVDTDFSVWNLVGNIVQPLFQGGRLRANVDLNEARTREALLGFGEAALRAFAEVENALVAEESLTDQERALADAAEQSVGAQRLAEEQYLIGLIEYITVLESQRRALTAQSELIRIRRQRLDARVDLHLALGGGFQSSDLPGAEIPEEVTPEEEESSS